jgi:hypothetical protein
MKELTIEEAVELKRTLERRVSELFEREMDNAKESAGLFVTGASFKFSTHKELSSIPIIDDVVLMDVSIELTHRSGVKI